MEPELSPAGGLPWPWIGAGVLALGVAGYLLMREGSSSRSSAESSPQAAISGGLGEEPSSDSSVRDPPDGSAGSSAAADAEIAEPQGAGDSGDASTPMPITGSGDPREPPPGTSPEIAAVFRRLPVSPSDGPPIGGIGANGIHIDEMRVGSTVSGGTCSGHTDNFSVSASDRAGVCVRVVHPREKDELQVLWEKHGGATRRSKMVVLPKHAYRTRGYLKLRKEYIGDWTVRILSSDGVELARHDFTIVP